MPDHWALARLKSCAADVADLTSQRKQDDAYVALEHVEGWTGRVMEPDDEAIFESMVNGPSPGPAPADQARASNSRLTRSSWRTWPHRKLRRKVPRVDGALTTQPMALAVPPRRISEVNVVVDEFTQTQVLGESDRKEQPSIGHQAVVIKGDLDPVWVVAW